MLKRRPRSNPSSTGSACPEGERLDMALRISRRDFVKAGLGAAVGGAGLPIFLQRSLAAAGDPSMGSHGRNGPDGVLVVVQLTGGNDGLNTVVPFGSPDYYKARPTINIPEHEVLVLDRNRGIGLHPAMAPIKNLIDEGYASIVQGVGYPGAERSHSASMDVWHSADPNPASAKTGWLGRSLDLLPPGSGEGAPEGCFCIGSQSPRLAHAATALPVSFQSAESFRWIAADLDRDLGKRYARLVGSASASEAPGSALGFARQVSRGAGDVSAKVRQATARDSLTVFPRSPLGQQLKLIAAMIRAELPTRVFFASMGGFDTHSQQLPRHAAQLREFAAAIAAFDRELAASRHRERVVTLAFSEFGRRVGENVTAGSDHGTAGPIFLFGGGLKPGLVGEGPRLAGPDEDLAYTTDFRRLYASVLDEWIGVDSEKVLGRRFDPVRVFSHQYGQGREG